MARRKKNNTIINIFLIILIVVLGLIIVKAIDNHRNKETTEIINEEKTKIKETKKVDKEKNTTKEEEKNTQKSSSDEKEEIKNEVERKGGVVNIELKGEDEITIEKGDKFTDPGFTATYEDGTDASSEVTVEGEVDTNKTGKYTISYYVGNNIVMRRVIVE